jgi:hypothetical protein
MSKDPHSQQHAVDHHVANNDTELESPEGDHDHDVARRASKAGLHREAAKRVAEADTKKTPTQAHDSSDQESYDAMRAQLQLLAAELYDGSARLENAMSIDARGDAGIEPAFGIIKSTADHVDYAAQRADMLVTGSKLDQTRFGLLRDELRSVDSAYDKYSTSLTRARNWVSGHDHPMNLEPQFARDPIERMHKALGVEMSQVTRDRAAPVSVDKARSTAIAQHIAAAQEAAHSVKAGNTGDGARMWRHIYEARMQVRSIEGDKKAMASHKKEFAALAKAVHEIEASNPDLFTNADQKSNLHELAAFGK